MKVKNIILEVKPLKKSLDEFAETYEKIAKGAAVKKKNVLSFDSVEVMRKILTPRRLELLRMIRYSKPKSIYGISKLVQRDAKSVNTDIKVLESLGMLESEKSKSKREIITPRVNFDKIRVEITI